LGEEIGIESVKHGVSAVLLSAADEARKVYCKGSSSKKKSRGDMRRGKGRIAKLDAPNAE